MVKIAFYGKGGIGKSTTVTNIAVALAGQGLRVLQVGCDPKADSTRMLVGDGAKGEGIAGSYGIGDMVQRLRGSRGGPSRTIMDFVRARAPFAAADVVREGYAGVLCAEAGGPLPGQGCAGRAVITALEKLEEIGAYAVYKPDIVLYDVLGDVVCGGFAMPMRAGFADYVYILTSGETMSLFAAANIGVALENFRGRGYARLGGIILNRRDVPQEEEKTAALADMLQTKIVGDLPRSPLVPEAEERAMCLLQAFPESEMADRYRGLAAMLASGLASGMEGR